MKRSPITYKDTVPNKQPFQPINAITHCGTGPNKDFKSQTRNTSPLNEKHHQQFSPIQNNILKTQPSTLRQPQISNGTNQENSNILQNQSPQLNPSINQSTFRNQPVPLNSKPSTASNFRNNIDPKYLSYGQQNITSILNQVQLKPESMGVNLIRQGNYQDNLPLKQIVGSGENLLFNRFNTQTNQQDFSSNSQIQNNRLNAVVQDKLNQDRIRTLSKLNVTSDNTNILLKNSSQAQMLSNLNQIKFDSVESNRITNEQPISFLNFQKTTESKQFCVNHPLKKGKYYLITEEGRKIFFCSKCSIEQASKGLKIFDASNEQEIEANSILGLTDDNHFKQNYESNLMQLQNKQSLFMNTPDVTPQSYNFMHNHKNTMQESKLINSNALDINQKQNITKNNSKAELFDNQHTSHQIVKEHVPLVSLDEAQQRSRDIDMFSKKLQSLKSQSLKLQEESNSKQAKLNLEKTENIQKVNKLFEQIRMAMLQIKKQITDQISQQDEIEALEEILDFSKSTVDMCNEIETDIDQNKESILHSIDAVPFKKIFAGYHIKVEEQKKTLESFGNFQFSKINTQFDEVNIISQLTQIIQNTVQIQNSSKPQQTTVQSPVPICKMPTNNNNKVVVSFQNKEIFQNNRVSKQQTVPGPIQQQGACSPSGMINPLSSMQIQQSMEDQEYTYNKDCVVEQEKQHFQKVLFSDSPNFQEFMNIPQINSLQDD